jgi:hypothetical protein
MGTALYFLLPHLNLFVALAASSLLYAVLLIALGALGPDERLLLTRLLPRRLERALNIVLQLFP